MHTLRRDSIRLLRKRCPECLEKFTQCSDFYIITPAYIFFAHTYSAYQKFTLTSAQAPAIKICSTTPVCLSTLLERRRSIAPEKKMKKKKKKYMKKVKRKHSFSVSSIFRVWFLLETVNGLGGRLRCLVLVLHGITH